MLWIPVRGLSAMPGKRADGGAGQYIPEGRGQKGGISGGVCGIGAGC
ncbi:hypothetical protein LS482_18925 [Sinomicrobium kalidii]|nr:hypothetical protein [Sinomicrobium kalidii]UGU15741.1 hypothetical protein LS482_18925 [Sinomicrobium kalidii]